MSMNNFGRHVPPERKTRALRHYREMNPRASTGEATAHIARLARLIEKDEPFECERFWKASMSLDFTGYIRLMSVLLTDEGAIVGFAPAKETRFDG